MSKRERRLIRRLQERDEAAFREMVREHEQQVFNLVFRMLGNREEAEDLAQDVFVTVFKSIDRFREESRLSTWIYRIAVNHCKNRYKYLARRNYHGSASFDDVEAREGTERDGPAIALQAQISAPDRILEGKRLEQALQRAIAELDEDQRVVIVLRDVEGLTYQEICAITDLAEGTVKSRLHRARMALKERLEREQ
ncbi:MAG: sigma-70 family RNA polymerase sigma factor [Deltaproteobacteria bacterium]|nr:sigma-70 family RNA polymerase sigma factor [Deltaproteobacteria bacterium]